jgi:hypothetical protein
MDTLIHGLKGSGKTYYAVNHISKMPDPSKVLHNIDDLSLGTHFDKAVKQLNLSSSLEFFSDRLHDPSSPSHNPEFTMFHGWLFVVDEAQKLFPKTFKNLDVEQFFQMSRHYQIDTFLITQDQKLISPSITCHSELTLRCVSDSANPVPGFFLYRKMIGNEQVGAPLRIRKSKKVFDLYKSTKTKKTAFSEKKSKTIYYYSGGFILFIIAVIVIFNLFTAGKMRKRKENKEPTSISSLSPTSRFKDNRKKSSKYDYDSSIPEFPETIVEKQHGIQVPISSVESPKGRYFIFLNNIFYPNEFPYQIKKTPFGLYALVDRDSYNYYQKQKETFTDSYQSSTDRYTPNRHQDSRFDQQ